MARRTIRTIDRQVFSDRCNRFENHKGYILYVKGPFNEVRINKRGIVSDDVNGLPTPVIMALVVFTLMALLIGLLLLNRNMQPGEVQNNSNLPVDTSIVVIASKKSGLYYLPGCPEYLMVKPEHKVNYGSEQQAFDSGYRKSKNCP